MNINRGQTLLAERSTNRTFFFKKLYGKDVQQIYFLCIKEYLLYIIFIFADTGYWSNLPYMSLRYQNSVPNIISVKNCITHYVTNLLRRFIFTRENNTRTTPVDNLHITVIHSFFIKNILYKQKPWFWPTKKIKNEIKTKPALLSHRTLEQSV